MEPVIAADIVFQQIGAEACRQLKRKPDLQAGDQKQKRVFADEKQCCDRTEQDQKRSIRQIAGCLFEQ